MDAEQAEEEEQQAELPFEHGREKPELNRASREGREDRARQRNDGQNGKEEAKALDYVAIPDSVVSLIEKSWEGITGADGKPVFTAQ